MATPTRAHAPARARNRSVQAKSPSSSASRSAITSAKRGELAVQAARNATANIESVVKPQARDRWSQAALQNLTPDRVVSIMRGVIAGSFVAQHDLFDLMEDTWPRLKKNLNELKRAVIKVDMIAVAYGSEKTPSALALKKQEVLETAIAGTLPRVQAGEGSWEDAIYDVCDAIGKGISVQEILWEIRETAAGPMTLPRAFQWVYPRHYGYFVNNPDLLLSVSGIGSDYTDFPEDKFILAPFKTKSGHLLTSALLRALATMWIGANFSYDWALNLAQMFGLPIRWATYDPTNPKLVDEICDMLENMGSAGWGAFPAGTTLELKEAVGNAAHNPQSFLMELADVSCDILILGQTLTTTQGARGAMALGKVHQDVRAEVIEYVASWVAKIFNYQFVPALMRLNFGNNDEDPYLMPDIEQQRDALSMAQRDEIIVSKMQVPVKRSWFYNRHAIPMPEEGDDLLEVPQITAPDPTGGSDNSGDGGSTSARRMQWSYVSDVYHAKGAQAQLVDHVLEDVTGVAAKWLGPVKPFFARLLEYAKSDNVTDAELLGTIEAAAKAMPELFSQLNTKELQAALENGMSSALINGVSRGVHDRKLKEAA